MLIIDSCSKNNAIFPSNALWIYLSRLTQSSYLGILSWKHIMRIENLNCQRWQECYNISTVSLSTFNTSLPCQSVSKLCPIRSPLMIPPRIPRPLQASLRSTRRTCGRLTGQSTSILGRFQIFSGIFITAIILGSPKLINLELLFQLIRCGILQLEIFLFIDGQWLLHFTLWFCRDRVLTR